MAMQRGRLQQQSEALQQARERAQQKGGAPMPGKGMKGGPMKGKGPPGKGMPMPGKGPQAVKGGPKGGKGMPPPGVGLAPRGPPGKGLPGMMPKQAPAKPPPGAPQQAQAPGAPVDATPPAAKPQAPGDAAAGTPAKPAPKTGSEQIAQKSEAFMAEVKAKPVKITKKDIEKHAAQLEGEVAKMRAKVSSELNDRYRKAVAETNTLEDVRKELSVVDQIIAADVAVIRENIDVAVCGCCAGPRRRRICVRIRLRWRRPCGTLCLPWHVPHSRACFCTEMRLFWHSDPNPPKFPSGENGNFLARVPNRYDEASRLCICVRLC